MQRAANQRKRTTIAGKAKCITCPKLLPVEDLKRGLYCNGCHAREVRMAKQEVAKIEAKALAKASTKLADALAKAKDTSAITPEILQTFYDMAGGPTGYAKMLFKDFQKSRGEGLSEYEKETWAFNASTLARWHEIIMKIQQKEDERNSTDLSSVSPEDIEATVKQVALDMFMSDQTIREAVIQMACRQNPELVTELADASGKIALPKQADDIEYEE